MRRILLATAVLLLVFSSVNIRAEEPEFPQIVADTLAKINDGNLDDALAALDPIIADEAAAEPDKALATRARAFVHAHIAKGLEGRERFEAVSKALRDFNTPLPAEFASNKKLDLYSRIVKFSTVILRAEFETSTEGFPGEQVQAYIGIFHGPISELKSLDASIYQLKHEALAAAAEAAKGDEEKLAAKHSDPAWVAELDSACLEEIGVAITKAMNSVPAQRHRDRVRMAADARAWLNPVFDLHAFDDAAKARLLKVWDQTSAVMKDGVTGLVETVTVTEELNEITLREVTALFTKMLGISVVLDSRFSNDEKKVSLNFVDVPMKDALDTVCQMFDLGWTVVDDYIFVTGAAEIEKVRGHSPLPHADAIPWSPDMTQLTLGERGLLLALHRKIVPAEFEETPFKDCLAKLSEQSGVEFVLDETAADGADKPITITTPSISVLQLATWIIRISGLNFRPENGRIVVYKRLG